MSTTVGDILVELDAEAAPNTVLHFCDYVEAGYYDGTIFHRVVRGVSGSMIQGGGYTPEMVGKPQSLHSTLVGENGPGLDNSKYTMGMAKPMVAVDPSVTQFYINMTDNVSHQQRSDPLSRTVFGRVVDGFDALNRIYQSELTTHPNYAAGRSEVVPKTPIVIKSVRLESPLDRRAAEKIARDLATLGDRLLAQLIEKLERESGKPVTRTPSGLTYADYKVGLGAIPSESDRVDMHYKATLLNGKVLEDFSLESKQFDVHTMIPGLKEAMSTFREGGKRTVVVPPKLGFPEGMPGKIPTDATLVFELELLRIMDPS